ncbi:MAG: hypothetical protein M3264_08325 [Thermoproteota archaeon]|nr:hypothetical protein [Thermoproteota archaeon]
MGKKLRDFKLMVTATGSLLLARSHTHMPSSRTTTDSLTSKKLAIATPFFFGTRIITSHGWP